MTNKLTKESEELLKKIKRFNNSFQVSDYYEEGKLDVEYMTQDGYALMKAYYNGVPLEFSVNGNCSFEHEGEYFKCEEDLNPEVIDLLRKGEIDFDESSWFEFFDTDSYNDGEIDVLPQIGMMKQIFVEDYLYRANEAGNEDDKAFLLGFEFIGKTIPKSPKLTKEIFEKRIQEIFSHEDLFDVIPFFEARFSNDKYGDSHFGVFFYTKSIEAKNYVHVELSKL